MMKRLKTTKLVRIEDDWNNVKRTCGYDIVNDGLVRQSEEL